VGDRTRGKVGCPHCGEAVELPPAVAPPEQKGMDGSSAAAASKPPVGPRPAGARTEGSVWPALAPRAAGTAPGSSGAATKPAAAPRSQGEPGPAAAPVGEEYDPGPAFRGDLWRAIAPIRSWRELSTFLTVLVVILLWPFLSVLGLACCWVAPLKIVLLGLLMSFFFTVIADTTEGVNELPALGEFPAVLEHPWSEAIVPVTNGLASVLYTQLPALAAYAVWTAGPWPGLSWGPGRAVVGALGLAGMFLWPMVALVLTYDRIGLLLRPDLIVRSIAGIIGPYLLGWGCLLVGVGVFGLAARLTPKAAEFEEFIRPRGLLTQAGLSALDLTVFLYALRVIGLLGRHYRQRFAWEIERRPRHPLEEED